MTGYLTWTFQLQQEVNVYNYDSNCGICKEEDYDNGDDYLRIQDYNYNNNDITKAIPNPKTKTKWRPKT